MVTAVRSIAKGRPISKLVLTDKGRVALGRATAGSKVTDTGVMRGDELDLETLTRLTDEFSRKNPSWEWKLERKGAQMTK